VFRRSLFVDAAPIVGFAGMQRSVLRGQKVRMVGGKVAVICGEGLGIAENHRRSPCGLQLFNSLVGRLLVENSSVALRHQSIRVDDACLGR